MEANAHFECCDNCNHIRRLKHNEHLFKGFEESYCCVVFVGDLDGFIWEIHKQGMCEMFSERSTQCQS